MNRSLKLSMLLALTVGSGQAAAVELGQVHVRSALGQPLLAEIPVTPEGPGDLANLRAKLASSEDSAWAGIAGGRPSVPLLFSIVDAGSGKVIRITSSEAVNDPLLVLLVEVDNASGKSVREFNILLDPPGSTPTAPVLRAPVGHGSSPPHARSASAPAASVATPRRVPSAGVALSNGRFGPVQSGQNLSTLARSVVVPGADLNQMMLAFKQANPDAFYRDNINALKSGVVLRVPSTDEARAQSAAAALAEVRRQNSDWRAGIIRAPTSVADAATRSTASSSPSGVSSDSADHLSLTPSKDAGQGAAGQSGSASGRGSAARARQDLLRSQESLAALQQQGNDLKSRLKDLEDLNSKNQKLLSLKDNEIAELQHKLEEARKAAGAVATPAAPKPAAATAAPSVPPAARLATAPAASATAPASHATGIPAVASTAAGRSAAAKPAPVSVKKPVVVSGPAPAAEDPWYMQTWAWGVGAAVIVVLLGLAWLGRRRREPVATAAGTSSLADRFDTASLPADDGEDIDQEELLDQLAEHPDDIGLHLELVSLYYHRRDIEHFEAAAEAMHAHVVDPEQSEWQDVLAMGEDLVPEHPLFAAASAQDDHVKESHAYEDHDAEAQRDEQEALRAFDLDAYAVGDTAPLDAAPKPDYHKVSEYHFDFNLTPRAKAGNTTPPPLPAPAADVDAYGAAPHHDRFAVSAPAEASAAEHPTGPTWTFEEPVEPAAAEVELEPFTDDPVDTKLDLARAYLDMGDAEGAHAMLDEVLHEGSQMQRDVARRLLDSLA